MSISALTTVAAVRDERPPTKRDAGKSKTPGDTATASLTDLLATQVPTELVAPYTAVTAGIVGGIKLGPGADQLTTWRWLAFVILLVGTVGLVWAGKRRKAGGGKFPLLEITGALAAAVGWALALPESPLTPYLHSEGGRIAAPLLIAFGAVVFTSITAAALQGQRGT
jgi:hypothetical protein